MPNLVPGYVVGYKPESAFDTPGCCDFYTHETTTSWGKIMLWTEVPFSDIIK
jgi:hypothetical protein